MENVLVNKGIILHNFITGKGKMYNIYRSPFIDPGYIFVPIVFTQCEPIICDTNIFQPSEGVMSRYAETVVDNRFYGEINVGDFDTMDND